MPNGDDEAGSQRVVVVTGGAAGIGAAIAEELGREHAFVVTMDPVVSLDGAAKISTDETTTAERIVAAGGAALASGVSVTDEAAVHDLFAQLVDEFGSLDAVINVAGISRPTSFSSGTEDDWNAILSVHFDGYLNVLRAAMPIMERAGHGRILGVTSGSGWRAANAGAYGCAKRAVAALTWQVGQVAPSGVTVNALSPIAVTRMVTAAMPRRKSSDDGGTGASGGVLFGTMPPPENLGPIGAYLASDELSWSSGRVFFSNGAEVTLIAEPELMEVLRSRDVASLPAVLDEVIPLTFAAAEAAQASNGGSNPRFGPVFGTTTASSSPPADVVRSCVVVTDDPEWGRMISDGLTDRGVTSIRIGAGAEPRVSDIATGFDAVTAQLAAVAGAGDGIDAVIVALAGMAATEAKTAVDGDWQQILDDHAGLTSELSADAAWVRAVSDYATQTGRPMRVLTLTQATSAAGRSRAQVSAQLARAAHLAKSGRVDAIAISVETRDSADMASIADLVLHLTTGSDTEALSGAEIVAASGWFGLRSHPRASGSISFGGPDTPDWLDDALRTVVAGSAR